MSSKAIITAIIPILLFLPVFAFADMGFHPEATFTVTLDREPFNDALISLLECNENKRYEASDYSLSGLGSTNKISLDSNFLSNVLEPVENGKYLSRDEIEEYKNEYSQYAGSLDIPWNDGQLQLARQFVLDTFDEQKQCYWQPGERAFTDCENATCKVTYRVPSSFRIKVLDFETGKTYITQDIGREGLNTIFAVDFDSSSGIGYVAPSKVNDINKSFAAIIFPLIFIVNIIIELLAAIALAYFAFKIKIKKIIVPILLGNLVTHPLAYFAPYFFNFESAFMIALGMEIIILVSEAFAVLFEAFLMARMAKVKWPQAIWISFSINLLSLFIGAFIPF